MGQSTEMPPLVSMLFQTFLNLLKFSMEIFNILVVLLLNSYTDAHCSVGIVFVFAEIVPNV